MCRWAEKEPSYLLMLPFHHFFDERHFEAWCKDYGMPPLHEVRCTHSMVPSCAAKWRLRDLVSGALIEALKRPVPCRRGDCMGAAGGPHAGVHAAAAAEREGAAGHQQGYAQVLPRACHTDMLLHACSLHVCGALCLVHSSMCGGQPAGASSRWEDNLMQSQCRLGSYSATPWSLPKLAAWCRAWAQQYGVICLSGASTFYTIEGADQPMFWPPDGHRAALAPSGEATARRRAPGWPHHHARAAPDAPTQPVAPRGVRWRRQDAGRGVEHTCTHAAAAPPSVARPLKGVPGLCGCAGLYAREVQRMLDEVEHRYGSREFVGVHARVEADWEAHCAAGANRSDAGGALFGNRHQCWVRERQCRWLWRGRALRGWFASRH